jgi:gliding motility-associated-like protein
MMMQSNLWKIIFGFFMFVTATFLSAQTNLVLNPSLEDTICCPNSIVDIHCAVHWYQPHINNSSTDYFHTCNLAYFQLIMLRVNIKPRTGIGVARISTIWPSMPNHAREYLCGTLSSELDSGSCYNVKFHILTAHWLGDQYAYYGSNRIGISFSKDSILSSSSTFNIMPLPAKTEYQGAISCSLNQWVEVVGSFIANEGAKHFIIGNFYEDSLTNVVLCNQGTMSPYGMFSGFFIDDVSVWPCDAPVYEADAGNNKHICFGDEVILGQNLPDDEYRLLWSARSHRLTPKDQWDTLATTHYLSVKPAQTTTYYLWMRDFKMDVTYDSVTVHVNPCLTPPIIPNVFTPNGDGFNDVFAFKNHEGWELETCIRNRWGQVVFEGKNDNWWDGTIKGQQTSPGVYYYTVTARNHFGQHEAFHGVVTLLR